MRRDRWVTWLAGTAPPRWAVVVGLTLALLTLADVANAAATRPARLDLRAEILDGGTIVTRVGPAGLAWDAGLRPGDRVVAIDGHPASTIAAAAVADATRVAVRAPDGTEREASTTGSTATVLHRRIAFSFLALWFALLGGTVFVLATDRAAAALLLTLTTGAAAALLASVATPSGARWALVVVFVALNAFGASLCLFFLRFPVAYHSTRAGRAAAASCVAAHATLLVAYGVVQWFFPAAYTLVLPCWQATFLAELVASCGLATSGWWASPSVRREARAALAVVALGVAAGTLPFGTLTLLPPLFGVSRPVPPDLAVLSLALLPTGLAFALLNRRFLGITRLVRRGLIAATSWLALLGGLVVTLDGLRHAAGDVETTAGIVLGSTLTTGVIFAGIFPLAQGALRRVLERRLFPDQYDPTASLRQLGGALVGLPSGDIDALADKILAWLARTLDLTWCALALCDDGRHAGRWSVGAAPAHAAWDRHPSAGEAPQDRIAPVGDDGTFLVPLIADGQPVGTLALGPKRHDVELLPQDVAFVAALTPLVATALQSASRARALAEKVATLAAREETLAALNARLLRAQEEERRRIALELHDDPLQRAMLLARALEVPDGSGVPPGARAAALEIGSVLRAICTGLRPPILDDLGLPAALGWLAEDIVARTEEALDVLLDVDPAALGRLEPTLEAALFRVAQEALNNVAKHAAASRVTLALARRADCVEMLIEDDGRGVGAGGPEPAGPTTRLGMVGMRERLRPWAGGIAIATPAGGGTRVTATVRVGCGDD